MKDFNEPMIEVIRFMAEDIIVTSCPEDECPDCEIDCDRLYDPIFDNK